MCRLLGVSLPVGAAAEPGWLDAFAGLADTGIVSPGSTPGHRDGWGVAGMADGVPVVVDRERGSILADPARYATARDAALARRLDPLIVHLRKASPGLAVTRDNAHPFRIGGALFAHNGSLRHPGRLPVRDPDVIGGTTDSERWFAFLMEAAAAAPPAGFSGALADAVRAARTYTDASSWTFLLARGARLYAYREAREDAYPPEDEPPGECLRTHGLSLAPVAGVCVACSEPLPAPAGPWEPVANREMVVLEHGRIVERLRLA